MAITNKQIENVNTNLLLVPVDKTYAITAIMICNTYVPNPADESEGTVKVDMHFIPSGLPKRNDNMVINELELRAGETFSFDTEKIILNAGDRVVLVGNPELVTPAVSAGSFEVNKRYEITSLGTTDWNLVAGTTGEVYNIGSVLVAQNDGSGNGDGEARLSGYTSVTATTSYLEL